MEIKKAPCRAGSMDVLKFVNSKDIRKHLQDIGYECSPLEAAWLIYQCRSATVEEKHAAWDDLIETMLLSLIYEGRFYSFSPETHLDKTGLTLIRPLIYVEEADVIGFKNKYHLPVCKNPCPVDGKTKREYVKQLTKKLNHDSPGVKDRFFHAIIDGNNPGWPERTDHHLKNLIRSDLSSSPEEEL